MPVQTLRDIESIEREEPWPFDQIESTYDLLRHGAAINPSASALSFFLRVEDHATPVRWSYAEWLADITRAANMFRRLGVNRSEGRGDVVACILPNLPETHIALWGAETAGIAFAVNPLLDGKQMGELLRAAKTRWVVTTGPAPDPEIWDRVASAIAGCPGLRGVLAIDASKHLAGYSGRQVLPAALAGTPVLDLGIEMAREAGDALGFSAPRAGDIASYFCTGGTTGLPKIARHLQRNEVANAMQLAKVAPELISAGRTMLTALPLFHVNAQLGTGLAVFGQGGHVVLAPPAGYRAPGLIPRFWEIVERHAVNAFSAVPTVYAGLLQVPRAGRDVSSLTHAICGAAPMPVELFRAFEREMGMRILEGYGLTESACVSSLNPAGGESRIGSIGLRMPWQPMRTMIVGSNGALEREAAVDEVGAICVSGPNVFPGYLDPAHDTGNWFDTTEPNGEMRRWFNTGDLGRMDAEGFFWLTGRKKELIIRGGHNIDPKIIEEALAGHPAVAMCAAVGRPDARAGEVPVAYVQLRAHASADEPDLLAYASKHIAERAAVPKAVRILAALPVTAVGKIFKPSLQLREVEGVVRDEAAALGVSLAELTVEQDAKLGILARYRVEGGDAVGFAAALGRHIFRSKPLDVGTNTVNSP